MRKEIGYYMSLPYTIILIPSSEGGYAVKMIEDAKFCWLDAAIEDRLNIPEPEKEYFPQEA